MHQMVGDAQRYDPSRWVPPLVVLIGLGTGKDDLSPRTLRWIDRAEVLAGGRRQLDGFSEHCGMKIPIASPVSGSIEQVRQVSVERRTVVLASGDPFFFGIGRRLVESIGRERLHTIPNITTVQALFARLAEPWDDVRILTLHGRDNAAWLRELRCHSRLVLFTDPQHSPAWIARTLVEAGVDDCLLVVGEDIGLPTERVRRFTPQEAAQSAFSPLNLVALFRVSPPEGDGSIHLEGPILGLPEEAFRHRAGLITKMEIRAVVLAHLQLEPGLVLWDLGAGSGSVSIEAARMVPLRKVLAVEKDGARFEDLRQNVLHFRCAEIEAVHGSAPEALQDLPDPDRVFLGGSGGNLQETLRQVARRLRPGGRVVQTAVMLDTLNVVSTFWKEQQFDVSVTQIQVNRSAPIGKSLRFDALNPVFIISASRRGG